MDMLQGLLGGDRQQEYQDFAQRYQQGPPWTGFDEAEAAQRYQEVAPRLSPQQYRSSAEEAFSRLTPEQRAEFGQWLAERSRDGNMPTSLSPSEYSDPGRLAEYTSQVHQQRPDMLSQLLGGVTSGGSGGMGGMLSSPIAKAALGGIAAIAVQKMMSRR